MSEGRGVILHPILPFPVSISRPLAPLGSHPRDEILRQKKKITRISEKMPEPSARPSTKNNKCYTTNKNSSTYFEKIFLFCFVLMFVVVVVGLI